VGATQVQSGGTFAPGSPGVPGTGMTVNATLAFGPTAIYLVQVNPSSVSNATVTGTAALGGNVLAAFASGSYLTKQYTILSSAGLGGTTFASLGTTSLPAGFTAALDYTATDVMLDITGAVSTGGLSGNEQAVATSINNFFNGGGTLPPNFLTIFGLSGGNLAAALDQLSGEAAADSEQSTFTLMTQFLGLMLDPSADGFGDAGGGAPLGFAAEQRLPADVALAYAAVLKPPTMPAPPERRFAVWGSGYGGSNKLAGNASIGSHDSTARTYGYAAGIDYRLTPDTTVGVALAGGGTNWSLAQRLGGGSSNAFQAGLYGKTRFGPAYLAAAFGYAEQWISTDRFSFAGDHLTADYTAPDYAGRIETGYRFAMTPRAGVTPYAAAQTQMFHLPAYAERDLTGGGFGLSYQSQDATDTRSEFGARFDDRIALANGMALILRAREAWAHDWVSNPSITAAFQTLPGASFTVGGATPASDSALTSAGAELRLTPALSIAAKFDGEFARTAQTYAGTGTVRLIW
jgi:outer membrane autotransporter protein